MPYNILELTHVGANTGSGAGGTRINLVTNPGPNIRIYLFASGHHDDPVARIGSILIVTTIASEVGFSESLSLVAATNQTNRITIQHSVIVLPGENLRLEFDGMGTASASTFRAIYVEIPEGQTLYEIGH